MKTKNIMFALALLVAPGVVFTACNGNANKQAKRDKVLASQEVVNYPIPTAYEVTNLINRSGAAYVIGITNPASKADQYVSDAKKALAIGVYGADLAYVSTYNLKQETMDYMKVLKKMSDEMNISTNFNADLAKKIEDHIGEKDTLIRIISDSFHDTYSFLINNGKDDLSLFVLAGTWVEGLYITAQVANSSAHNEDMLQIVANQKLSLKTLLDLLEDSKSNPEVAQLLKDFEPLKKEYAKVAAEGSITLQQSIKIEEAAITLRDKIVL